MRKRVVTSVALAAALLSGCEKIPGTAEYQARKLTAEMLIDPSSAQFRSIKRSPDGKAVCGEINGKNRMGAYVGFTPFYHEPGLQYAEMFVETPSLSYLQLMRGDTERRNEAFREVGRSCDFAANWAKSCGFTGIGVAADERVCTAWAAGPDQFVDLLYGD